MSNSSPKGSTTIVGVGEGNLTPLLVLVKGILHHCWCWCGGIGGGLRSVVLDAFTSLALGHIPSWKIYNIQGKKIRNLQKMQKL
jgi:hypothetical protein